jgi:hypothetical protein
MPEINTYKNVNIKYITNILIKLGVKTNMKKIAIMDLIRANYGFKKC